MELPREDYQPRGVGPGSGARSREGHPLAADHHEARMGEKSEVGQRIAGHRDEVGELAGGDGADPILPAEQLGADASRGLDRLHRRHAGAVERCDLADIDLLAAIGVTIEAIRVGGLPWISLTLAATFGFYGLMRKQLPLDSANGLFLETACMTPLALGYLLWLSFNGQSHFGVSTQVDLMLAATGVVTAIPLLLFAIAARRLPLSTIGFLQYLAPTISFMIAIFLYHEPMNVHRALGFAMIWTALIVYSIDMLRARR